MWMYDIPLMVDKPAHSSLPTIILIVTYHNIHFHILWQVSCCHFYISHWLHVNKSALATSSLAFSRVRWREFVVVGTNGVNCVDDDDHGTDAKLWGQPYVAVDCEAHHPALPDTKGCGRRSQSGYGLAQTRFPNSSGHGTYRQTPTLNKGPVNTNFVCIL